MCGNQFASGRVMLIENDGGGGCHSAVKMIYLKGDIYEATDTMASNKHNDDPVFFSLSNQFISLPIFSQS